MVGHGSPKASHGSHPPIARAAVVAAVCRGALVVSLALASHALMADDLRVRIAWGGGSERLWHGTISVRDGLLSQPRPLGVEADEPGSMWLDGDPIGSRKLVVRQRSPRGYDGVDVLVTASSDAVLLVQLAAEGDSSEAPIIEVPLTGLSDEFVNKELDNHGNRLLVMRTPGDSLRVQLACDSLVFAPGDVLKCTLQPHALSCRILHGCSFCVCGVQNETGSDIWQEEKGHKAGHKAMVRY